MPTNKPMVRIDDDDEVYRTAAEKIPRDPDPESTTLQIRAASRCWWGRPRSRSPRRLAEQLRQRGWEQHDFSDPERVPRRSSSGDEGAAKAKVFAILNARYHEQEAYIVAQAGVPGAITIATSMAGRGTDIQLGGNADMRVRQELADVSKVRNANGALPRSRTQVTRLKEEGAHRRRALRARHRASRKPAHRQSAAWPFRPPGRPRPFALLPFAPR